MDRVFTAKDTPAPEVATPSGPVCSTCKFYGGGLCKLEPPRYHEMSTGYPQVKADDWCGSYSK